MTPIEQATIDELAIRTLVARYADAVMRRDCDAVRATWSHDGAWDLGFARAAGADEIVALWERLMAKCDLVLQTVHSGTVVVERERGRGRWYFTELNRDHDGNGIMMAAVYDDVYTKLDGEWRFSSRRFDVRYRGPAVLTGSGDAVVQREGV